MSKKIPRLCHFKPRNLACVWINPDKRLYLGPYGSPESHERYAKIVRMLLAGQTVTKAPDLDRPEAEPALTVAGLAEQYLEHSRSYYTRDGVPTGEHDNVARAVKLAAEAYGAIPCDEFGPLCLEEVRDRLVRKRLARSTINGRIRRIVAMFKWGAAKQLFRQETYQALTMVSGLRAGRSEAREPDPVTPVPDEVVDATILQLPDVVADMVRFQRLTGARPGEVCAIRPIDIDRTDEVWSYRPAAHKTHHHGRERTVLIGPKAQAVLRPYLNRDEETCCFRPCDSEAQRRAKQHAKRTTPLSFGNRPRRGDQPFPTGRAGERYNKDSYANAIRRACKRAEVQHWSPNQLRHSYATAVRREYGLEAAQVLLGHSTARTTETYAEKNSAAGAAVARAIG
ncbi:MAG: site-specific integrase [Planctomycetota bacterium]